MREGDVMELEGMSSMFGMDLESLLEGMRRTDTLYPMLWKLKIAGGTKARIRHSGPEQSHVIVSAADVLRNDLAPVVILDASARVRHSYRLWEEHRGNLKFLEEAPRSYRNLTLHWWNKGAGRSTIRKNPELYAQEVAAVINKDVASSSSHKWLVVLYKRREGERNLKEIIQTKLSTDALDMVHFLTWGQHTATNDFVDYTHALLVGGLYLSDEDTEASCLAAMGLDGGGEVPPEVKASYEVGEQLHHILQAGCRIGIRRATLSQQQQFHLYLIASGRHGMGKRLQGVFPGCKVVDWTPEADRLVGNQKILVEFLDATLKQNGDRITFKEVRCQLGMNSSRLSEVRGNSSVIRALDRRGIEEEKANVKMVAFRRTTGDIEDPADSEGVQVERA